MRESFELSKKELKALVFWASSAVNKSNGGSYADTVVDTITKFSKELHLLQGSFCAIGYKSGLLGVELADRLNKNLGLRIKIRGEWQPEKELKKWWEFWK